MKKAIPVLIFLGLGLLVLGFWAAGSHGQLRFRPHMVEDWIYTVLILVCFALAIFFLLKTNK